MLEDLAVVIPSFCRPALLTRSVSLWENTAAQIIVVDGSPDGHHHLRSSTKITYLNRPDLSLAERLVVAGQLVNRKFVTTQADDDLVLLTAIGEALRLLTLLPSAVAVNGQRLHFGSNGAGELACTRGERASSIVDNSAAERMRSQLCRYFARSYYSVMRSDDWRFCVSYLDPFERAGVALGAYGLGELGFELAAACRGHVVIGSHTQTLTSSEDTWRSVAAASSGSDFWSVICSSSDEKLAEFDHLTHQLLIAVSGSANEAAQVAELPFRPGRAVADFTKLPMGSTPAAHALRGKVSRVLNSLDSPRLYRLLSTILYRTGTRDLPLRFTPSWRYIDLALDLRVPRSQVFEVELLLNSIDKIKPGS